MSLISIIIPVYNTEKYLPRCLDSIYKNNFSDIEIIIVDDFSTGKCENIIEPYNKEYNNIKYIRLEKNSGILVSRDIGIKQATSKYIMCIDSDDYIEKNTLEELEKEIINDYDIIAFNYIYEDKNKRKTNPYYEYEISKNLHIDNALQNLEILFSKRITNLTCKIIKKELYDKIEIEDKYINYMSSYFITPKLFYYAKNIKYITYPYYVCSKRVDSIVNTLATITFNQKENTLSNLAYISDNIYSFLKNKNMFDSLRNTIELFEYITYTLMYNSIISNTNKAKIKYIDTLFSNALPSMNKYNKILDKIEKAKLVKSSVPLSIVVPVFNTEPYLPRCLDSILNQSFKDLEIIIVDDYSHGNCREIVENYQKNGHSNLLYIKNEENLGSAWARINGASYAKGEYIHFIDSDDWVVEECYQKQMKYLNNKFDVLYFNHYMAYENNLRIENYNKIVDTTLSGKRAAFDDMFFNPLTKSRTLWARIFSRKCVLLATKHMPKLWISIADDWIFNLFILYYAKNYKSISDHLYCYFQDNPIAMTTTAENKSKVSSKKLNKLITQYYYAVYSLTSFFIEKKIWNTYRINWTVYIAADLQHHFINTLSGFEKNILDNNDKKSIYEECKNFFNNETSMSHIFSFIRHNNYLSHELSIRKFNQFARKSFLYKITSTFISPLNLVKTIFNKDETDDKIYIKLLGFNITIIKKKKTRQGN